jgi:hemerythrin
MTPSDSGLNRRLAIEGRRIAAQHAKLGELCVALIDAVADDHVACVRAALATLREGLLAHFDVEERVQIPALHGSNPSLEPQLQRIIDQHTRFRSDLQIFTRAMQTGDLKALREPLALFVAALAKHEAQEEELFGVR